MRWTFWKSGELQLMAFAIFISVLSMTSIAFVVQALQTGLEDKRGALLGSDRAIISPTPLNPALSEKAKNLNLNVTTTVSFLSMLVHGNDLALADVCAVEKGYPLRGQLRTALNVNMPDEITNGIPAPGTLWLDARLFALLNISAGDNVTLGTANFKATRVLTSEPDRTAEGVSLGPWALMNEADLLKTGIIQPGSKVTYKLLIAGSEDKLNQWEPWVKSQLLPSQQWMDTRHSRPIVNLVVDRVNHYLGLVFLINMSLAGIAIAMALRQFTQRQWDTVAILRCFGASGSWILWHYGSSLVLLGLLFGGLGILAGYGVQAYLIQAFFKDWLTVATGQALVFPLLIGLLTALILLFGFALPPIFGLRQISPLRVLRRDMPAPVLNQYISFSMAIAAIVGLIILQTRDVDLMGPLIVLTLIGCMVMWGVIYIILCGVSRSAGFFRVAFALNLRNIGRRAKDNTLAVLSFSLVLGLLASLYLVKGDLLKTWQDEVPLDAPNYFVLNLPPSQITAFQKLLQNNKIESSVLYPMMVSRLMAVNNDPVEMVNDPLSQKRTFNRLLNITWTGQLPPDNQMLVGQWFTEKNQGELVVSIEQGFADRLKIKEGDTLTLQIDEKVLTPRIISIRKVNWNSFHPNFFVIFPPGVIDKLPNIYMTSFYLAKSEINFLKILVQNFPMVNIIDIQTLISQLRFFIHVVADAIQYLWLFTILISFILLFATIAATLTQRKEEAILLRALGVGNRQLLQILLSEFAVLGFIAGAIGICSANILLYWFAPKFFNLPYRLDSTLLVLIPLLGMFLVGLGGWLGTRQVFLTPPLHLLREG